jgi:hypothetical protein
LAEDLTSSTTGFIKGHPYWTAGIVLGVVLVVWWLVSSGSATTATTTASGTTDDTGTTDAAAIQAAQLTANSNLAQAQLAANALNNQTAAGQTVALASIAGQQAGAAYEADASVASSNSAVAIAQAQVQGDEQLSNNATLASEYADLSATLASYFAGSSGGATGTPTGGGSSGDIADNPVAKQTAGNIFTGFASQTTPLVAPNLAANNSAFLTGLGGLTAGLGVGLQTPQTASLSSTQILSLAAINTAAVNNVGGLPQA